MRTTLKKGIGRGAELNGNGYAVLPPSVVTRMTRYRQPKRSALRFAGKILFGGIVELTKFIAQFKSVNS